MSLSHEGKKAEGGGQWEEPRSHLSWAASLGHPAHTGAQQLCKPGWWPGVSICGDRQDLPMAQGMSQ